MTDPSRFTNSTASVHGGDSRKKAFSALAEPIVQTATYTFADTDEIVAFKSGEHAEPHREEYGRYGNPSCRAVEVRLAALEGTEDALLFGSGMAAMTTVMVALLKQGDHVVLFRDCYRQTRQFVLKTLAKFGVANTLVEPGDLAGLQAALRPETKLVVSESPTNPYLNCIDLAEVARICKGQRGVRTVIDATFATPINCRPAQYGIDIVVHSATKYLSGHNDVLAGAVAGSNNLVSLIRESRDVLGNVCDPHAAFLVGRGMKTLALRVERQNANALALARFLERHPRVEKVYYPGLESHPSHAVAKRQMSGFGGVVSFVVKDGLEGARKVVDGARLARIAPSLGGVETLIEPPAIMSYFELTPEQRAQVGIEEGLVRLAVGIEDEGDLLADLVRALAS